MTFQTVPIQIAGGSSPNRSKPLSVQSSINMWPQLDTQGKDQFTLQSMYGTELFGNAVGAGRGMIKMSGILYRVAGGSLYSVSDQGVHSNLGLITGDKRCIFATNGLQLAICNGDGQVYVYTVSEGLVEVSDTDIVGAVTVDVVNNQFIYTLPNQVFVISDVGDATQASGLNAAQAESQPDELVRAFVFQQIIFMMGSESIEAWINTGQGSPPVQRQEQQILNIGLAGRYAVTNNDTLMYWLSDDGFVYRMQGLSAQKVSSQSIAREIQSYAVIDDCVASWFTIEGLDFILFKFPTQGVSWCLNESLGVDGWFKLSEGVTDENFRYDSPVSIYDKILLESSNGDLVYFKEDKYTYQNEIAKRERTLSPFTSQVIGAKNKEIRISRLSLEVETGVGLLSGQGEDPIIRLEASTDGGRTWLELAWPKIGRLGDYIENVKADFMLTCYTCVFRLTCTDPVKISIHSASVDVKLTGRR